MPSQKQKKQQQQQQKKLNKLASLEFFPASTRPPFPIAHFPKRTTGQKKNNKRSRQKPLAWSSQVVVLVVASISVSVALVARGAIEKVFMTQFPFVAVCLSPLVLAHFRFSISPSEKKGSSGKATTESFLVHRKRSGVKKLNGKIFC